MTPNEASAVARVPTHWRRFVRAHYRLPKNQNLAFALSRRGITFVDLVLLFVDTPHATVPLEALIGRPIVRCPPAKLEWRVNGGAPTVRLTTCWRDMPIRYVNSSYGSKYDITLRTVACRTPRGLHRCGIPWRTLQHMLASGDIRVGRP